VRKEIGFWIERFWWVLQQTVKMASLLRSWILRTCNSFNDEFIAATIERSQDLFSSHSVLCTGLRVTHHPHQETVERSDVAGREHV
jgi:hypothetical protein